MNDTTSVTRPTDLPSAVRLVRILHDTAWGWSRPEIDAIVAANAPWRLAREFADLAVFLLDPPPGPGFPSGPELHVDARAPKDPHCIRARMTLLEFGHSTPPEERREALRQLSEALREIGEPRPAPASAEGFGLRWQSPERTLLLQTNERRAWISVQPVVREAAQLAPEALDLIAGRVAALHDAADGAAREQELVLHTYAGQPSLEQRREAFGEAFRAVCGVIGEPTLYGGGPAGPDVRWRPAGEGARLLRLRGDGRRIRVECGPADGLEEEEHTTFEHGGAWGGDGPSDFPRLPYSWQLVLSGPGDTAVYLPGGRLALTMAHLREALEVLLTAWVEQLPVQRPAEKVTFTVAAPQLSGGLAFTYDTAKGFLLRVGGRPGEGDGGAAAMSALGWQPSGTRWKAEFKKPGERAALEVAALIVGELAARGITEPHEELTAKRVGIGSGSHGAHGFFRATGLGMPSR